MAEAPPLKRAKLDGLPAPCGPIRKELLGKASREALAHEFTEASPFAHCVLRPFCADAAVRQVHQEITERFESTLKESDLFRVFQTIDLGNIDGSAPQNLAAIPALLDLRTALYSKDFRAFVSEITGCGKLSGTRTDCAVNLHRRGCHLLCHDDAISTRRVSFILYLTPPSSSGTAGDGNGDGDGGGDGDWQQCDGGALELYPGDGTEHGRPAAVPECTLLPLWNSLCMFTVQPGITFHAVQEVTSDRPRLAIQGWYHAPTPEEVEDDDNDDDGNDSNGGGGSSSSEGKDKGKSKRMEAATVQQLITPARCAQMLRMPPMQAFQPPLVPASSSIATASADKDAGTVAFDAEGLPMLSAAELRDLGQWIDPAYLSAEGIDRVRAQFCDESHCLLHSFLRAEVAARIAKHTKSADFEDGLLLSGPRARDADDAEDVPLSLCESMNTKPADHTAGVGSGWTVHGPPHMQRFARACDAWSGDAGSGSANMEPARAAAAKELAAVRTMMSGISFAKLLVRLTSVRPRARRAEARRFRPGLDYTVANYGSMTPAGAARLDAVLCFVDDGHAADSGGNARRSSGHSEKEELWASGEVGGFECYVEADAEEAAEASEVFRMDDDDEPLVQTTASFNSLSLVLRDQGVLRFVKYVGCAAPGSRWDVNVELEIDPPEDDGEGAEEEEESEEEGVE